MGEANMASQSRLAVGWAVFRREEVPCTHQFSQQAKKRVKSWTRVEIEALIGSWQRRVSNVLGSL